MSDSRYRMAAVDVYSGDRCLYGLTSMSGGRGMGTEPGRTDS